MNAVVPSGDSYYWPLLKLES